MNEPKTSDTDAFTLLDSGFGSICYNCALVLPSWNENICNLFFVLQAKGLWLFGLLVLSL